MRAYLAALILLTATACAPRPAPAPPAAEPPKPAPIAAEPPLPPGSEAATLMEASCVRMGSLPMGQCACWSRLVAPQIDPKVAAAYGIQSVAKRADAMTALKPDLMKAFLAASDQAEATCAKRRTGLPPAG